MNRQFKNYIITLTGKNGSIKGDMSACCAHKAVELLIDDHVNIIIEEVYEVEVICESKLTFSFNILMKKESCQMPLEPR